MRTRPILPLVAALALAGAGALAAEPKETIEMADGSVYMGHTSRQNLAESKSLFLYDSAMIVMPRKDIGSLIPQESDFDKLSESWRNWFVVRPQYVHVNADGKRYVNLYSLADKEGVNTNIFLISRSPEYIKYYTIAPGGATLADADIRVVRYGRRDALDITGIVTEIETVDGEIVRGQLVEDSAEGKGILTDGDVVEIVPSNKIASLRRLPLDTDSGIETQIEFLDKLTVSVPEGEPLVLTGIITYMNYRTDGKPDLYLEVYDPYKKGEENMRVETVRLMSKAKSRNSLYTPRRGLFIADDSIMFVNGKEMLPARFVPIKDGEEFLADEISLSPVAVSPGNGEITLSMRAVDANNRITLMSIRTHTDGDIESYKFNYRDIVENAIEGDRKASRNGVASITYTGLTDGIYLVFNQNTKKAYVFQVGEEDVETVG